jgi:hypothetical protein
MLDHQRNIHWTPSSLNLHGQREDINEILEELNMANGIVVESRVPRVFWEFDGLS